VLKKDVLGTASSKSLEDAFKCGECLHFTQSCHPRREAVCKTLGVRAFALAPACFTPDVTKIITNTEQFVVLASIFNSYTAQQKRILLGTLRGNKTTKGTKTLKFGTKVYLKTGKDVLNSYYCAYVVGYTSCGELILAGSADRRSAGSTFFAYLKTTEGLLTPKEWKLKRAELVSRSAFDDTTNRKDSALHDKYLDYEVPTIDTNPEMFERRDGAKPARRKSMRATELTEFIVS